MIAPPSDMPELTNPNTLPICPGGAASLTITSRGVFLAPVIRPPANNAPIVAGSGSETTPTSSNTATAPIVRTTTKGRWRLVRSATQPPTSTPPIWPTMYPVSAEDAAAGHCRHHEEREKHQHRSAQKQPGPAFRRSALRAACLVDQDSALRHDRSHYRETKQPDEDQGTP